jgi:ribosome-binding factor A
MCSIFFILEAICSNKDKKLYRFAPLKRWNSKKLYFCTMETNRQKKIGGVIQNDLVDILQGEVRKNGISNLIISVSKVVVTSDLSVATVHLSIFPQEKAAETLVAIKSNTKLIKHDLSQRVRLQLRKVPNLTFFIDDSLDYIEKIDNALAAKENPIENRDLLEKRRTT